MRLEDAVAGAPDNTAAVRRHFVKPGPSVEKAQPLEATGARVHPRPDFLLKKPLAVELEGITGGFLGWRVAGQNVRPFVVKISPRSVENHAVRFEIGGPAVDEANLTPHGRGRTVEADHPEHVRGRGPVSGGYFLF